MKSSHGQSTQVSVSSFVCSLAGREVADWDAEIGRLYIQGAQELDEVKRKAIYDQTQCLTQEYLPYIHLVTQLSLAAVRIASKE